MYWNVGICDETRVTAGEVFIGRARIPVPILVPITRATAPPILPFFLLIFTPSFLKLLITNFLVSASATFQICECFWHSSWGWLKPLPNRALFKEGIHSETKKIYKNQFLNIKTKIVITSLTTWISRNLCVVDEFFAMWDLGFCRFLIDGEQRRSSGGNSSNFTRTHSLKGESGS